MGQAVCLSGDEDIGNGVKDAEAAPSNQDAGRITLFRNGIDDAAEQDGLKDRDDCKNHVGGNHEGYSQPVACKVFQGLEIDL